MSNELGVIAVSMLNLFSERQHPEYGSKSHEEQLYIMLLSLGTTIAAFLLTVIGAGSTLAGLKAVAARISESGAKAAGLRRSAGGSQVVPLNALAIPQQVNLKGMQDWLFTKLRLRHAWYVTRHRVHSSAACRVKTLVLQSQVLHDRAACLWHL